MVVPITCQIILKYLDKKSGHKIIDLNNLQCISCFIDLFSYKSYSCIALPSKCSISSNVLLFIMKKLPVRYACLIFNIHTQHTYTKHFDE